MSRTFILGLGVLGCVLASAVPARCTPTGYLTVSATVVDDCTVTRPSTGDVSAAEAPASARPTVRCANPSAYSVRALPDPDALATAAQDTPRKSYEATPPTGSPVKMIVIEF